MSAWRPKTIHGMQQPDQVSPRRTLKQCRCLAWFSVPKSVDDEYVYCSAACRPTKRGIARAHRDPSHVSLLKKVFQALSEGPATSSELAAELNRNQRHVSTALCTLVKNERILMGNRMKTDPHSKGRKGYIYSRRNMQIIPQTTTGAR